MPDFDPKSFGASFQTFLDDVVSKSPKEEPALRKMVREHLGADLSKCAIVSRRFRSSDHANLQRALDAWLAEPGRTSSLVGLSSMHELMGIGLGQLAGSTKSHVPGSSMEEGPVEYTEVDAGSAGTVTCIQRAIVLAADAAPSVLLVTGPSAQGFHRNVTIEVMTAERAHAEKLLATLETAMRAKNVYRGQIISLVTERDEIAVRFHRPPVIERDQIVLPVGVLERVERQTLGFAKHVDRLRSAGRHLKRGLLLHGPPGTGKTLTAMYLAAQMRDRTVLLLTGRGLGLLEASCVMARTLQPSLLVLEDVDLIAEERTRQLGCSPLLFELLNQMDGLEDDADVISFSRRTAQTCSSRRSRRVPAASTRRSRSRRPTSSAAGACSKLYGRGLTLELRNVDDLVRRTEGVSAAFIRELLRKAALFAAAGSAEPAAAGGGGGGGGGVVVNDEHIDSALHDLLVAGGPLTRSLLGAQPVAAR